MSTRFLVTEPLIAKVAVLAVTGLKEHAIAKALNEAEPEAGYTWRNIKNVMEHPKFKNTLEEMTRATLSEAKVNLRRGMVPLVRKAVAVVDKALDDGSLHAVHVVMKILGVEQEEQAQQQQALIVQLPNISNEKKVEDIDAVQNRSGKE